LTGENATFVLNLLAAMDSINEKFWKMKVVWSKNFIENLDPIYQRRLINVFKEGDIMDYCKQKHYLNGINDSINPQRIVKNRIGKDSRVESIGEKTEKLKSQIQSIKEKFKSEWDINSPFYKTKYPLLDLDFQWRNILDWVNRKPKKAKESASGDLNLFFQRWLNKEKPIFNNNNKMYQARVVETDWEKLHKYDADEDDNDWTPEEEKERLLKLISEYETEIKNISPEGTKRLEHWRERLEILGGSK
jgi:hypothetical protein